MQKGNSSTHPVRILFLIDSFRMGGAERITAEILCQIDRQAYFPLLGIVNSKDDSSIIDHFEGDLMEIIDLRSERLLDFGAFFRLLALLRRKKIQLIHAQLQDATIMAAMAGFFTGIPFVVTRHLVQDDESNWRRRTRNRLEQFLIRTRAARLIAVSDAARDLYIKDAGLPSQKCVTIYNGIDLDVYTQSTDPLKFRAGAGIPDNVPLVVMVGVIREGKGHALAIEAVRALNGVHLMVVGDGDRDLKASLKELAAPCAERIHFLGQRMDIPEILSASDILILPSYSEALPTVLIEAGAASLPCVASDVGGCREIVVHEETGLIIPPGDVEKLVEALTRLLSDMDMAQRMGRAGLRRIKSLFTSKHQAQQLIALYDDVLAKKNTR